MGRRERSPFAANHHREGAKRYSLVSSTQAKSTLSSHLDDAGLFPMRPNQSTSADYSTAR
jgi:hypothetical protein